MTVYFLIGLLAAVLVANCYTVVRLARQMIVLQRRVEELLRG